jgi:hypothetical protein
MCCVLCGPEMCLNAKKCASCVHLHLPVCYSSIQLFFIPGAFVAWEATAVSFPRKTNCRYLGMYVCAWVLSHVFLWYSGHKTYVRFVTR